MKLPTVFLVAHKTQFIVPRLTVLSFFAAGNLRSAGVHSFCSGFSLLGQLKAKIMSSSLFVFFDHLVDGRLTAI